MAGVLTGLGTGIGLGICFSIFLHNVFKRKKLHQARVHAKDILDALQGKEEMCHVTVRDNVEAYKLRLMNRQNKNQEEITRFRRRTKNERDQFMHQQRREWQKHLNEKNKKAGGFHRLSETVRKQSSHLKELKNEWDIKAGGITQHLQKKFDIDIARLKTDYQKKHLAHTKDKLLQEIKNQEEYFVQNISREAQFILDVVLARFMHPYSAERGIKAVVFSSPAAMRNLLGADGSRQRLLEKACGVDMKVSEQEPLVTIMGIDPVRRELGRAVLQQVAKKHRLKEEEIPPLVQKVKRQVFYQIKQDGERICRTLNLQNVKTEVKNLMGVLRYRYSFAQNQYFHCMEVGWLCGLLNAELGLPLPVGRRAGMFHDIGKAIDYSKEGGHAVIGADFIQKYQEPADIVHAVRAHHYDVAPGEPLDFLVIAADALSGARPGARRSTLDFYNQKVLTLEKIAHSFKGVKETYIMSAGREMRVIVDSDSIKDRQALELSKKIARKIEEECSYPGLIKVTVVRRVSYQVAGPQDYRGGGIHHQSS